MAQNFYPTATIVIQAALEAITAIDPEATSAPTTIESASALTVFNFLVTSWQAHGMQVWLQKLGTSTLTATSSFTVGPSGAINQERPLAITQAWLRNSATDPVDTPLEIVDRDTYNMNSTKTQGGIPTQLFYDPEYAKADGANAKGKIYLWPAPDASAVAKYDLYFVYTRPLQDFSAGSDTLDFPQYWFNAVKWNLAYELSFNYGLPIETQNKLKDKAKETLDLALGFDVDQQSVFFQIDARRKCL